MCRKMKEKNPSLGREYYIGKDGFIALEIKIKSAVLLFKMLMRDEKIVFKKSKSCLKKLMSMENSPGDILPDDILKECVRPALNFVSPQGRYVQSYIRLERLIKVIAACFNEKLWQHLLRSLE